MHIQNPTFSISPHRLRMAVNYISKKHIFLTTVNFLNKSKPWNKGSVVTFTEGCS